MAFLLDSEESIIKVVADPFSVNRLINFSSVLNTKTQ